MLISKGYACINMSTRTKYLENLPSGNLKNIQALATFLCMFIPLTALNSSFPHCGLHIPELCLSSCPVLWFVQAPNPRRRALQ